MLCCCIAKIIFEEKQYLQLFSLWWFWRNRRPVSREGDSIDEGHQWRKIYPTLCHHPNSYARQTAIRIFPIGNSLENFTEKDQIDYLIKFWKNELNLEEKYNESLGQFAASLMERVSKTLNDQEKSFIGIPLQCRILAECFQSNVKELIETPTSTEHNIFRLLVNRKFDLISLYDRLMETKNI